LEQARRIYLVLNRLRFLPKGCTIAFTNVGPVAAHSEREWILIGMAECCAAKGYEATTVAEVCAAAGISPEAFDRVFADKAECLGAVMESVVEEAWRALDRVLTPDKPWAAAVRDGTVALLGLLAERPAFAHVALIEAPVAGGRAAALASSSRAALLSFLERGMEQAESGVPASAATGALAGVEVMVTGQILAGKAERLGELTPDVIYMLAVPFIGRGEAQRVAAQPARRGHLRAVA
jgi:AcrR family transcriptional regulator